MCGIAGYIGKHTISEPSVSKTLELMKNRGPDHSDWCCIENPNSQIYLLHSRLGILDLDERSNQPFQHKEFTLVFNGEIYNYIEVRKDLIQKGYCFRTNSDTEVLLKAYEEYGEACVDHFEGMWSFAIWDQYKNKLFLSRDRFAEKPLYFLETDHGLYFGSEVKFIRSLYVKDLTINKEQLLRYLILGYKSLYKGSETYFREINEIGYGSNLSITSNLVKTSYRYWKPEVKIDKNLSIQDAIHGARKHLLESMKIRLRSDVPLAFCLSGGVDSASLVSMAAKEFNYKVSTFSIIDNDERYDESDNIRSVIEDTGSDSTLVHLSYEDVIPKLKKLIEYHDAPVATITYFIHSLLSEKISEKDYRVAFSGTGADELFTGYYDHFLLHLNSVRSLNSYSGCLSDWKHHILPFVRNPDLQDPELYQKNSGFRDHVFDNHREFRSYSKQKFNESYSEVNFDDSLLRSRMLNELFHEATPVILHEDDLNSMCYSIENRSPFLDSRLLDFMLTVPDEYLIQKGFGKYILREAMSGILTDKVRLDRRKRGFNASINTLFDFDNPEIREFVLDPSSPIMDLIDINKIEKLLDINPSPNHYSKFLFSFINAKIFLEQNKLGGL